MTDGPDVRLSSAWVISASIMPACWPRCRVSSSSASWTPKPERAAEIAAQVRIASRSPTRATCWIASMPCRVAVPTVSHVEVARPFLERGIPVLVEKPLAASLAEADG